MANRMSPWDDCLAVRASGVAPTVFLGIRPKHCWIARATVVLCRPHALSAPIILRQTAEKRLSSFAFLPPDERFQSIGRKFRSDALPLARTRAANALYGLTRGAPWRADSASAPRAGFRRNRIRVSVMTVISRPMPALVLGQSARQSLRRPPSISGWLHKMLQILLAEQGVND
jgi:hypothetical protein